MALSKINYLKLEDIKIGMEVETKQLERIYDVYIILSNVRVRQLRRDVLVTGIIKEFNERQLCAVEDGDAIFSIVHCKQWRMEHTMLSKAFSIARRIRYGIIKD